MKDKTFDFLGTKFTIKVLSSETDHRYTVLDVIHPPNLGPALHKHPRRSETFYIIDGDYNFISDERPIGGKPGNTIFVPKETPHRLEVGSKGGHAIVISPPELEFYFFIVGELFSIGKVSHEEESCIGEKYGQVFLYDTRHWI